MTHRESIGRAPTSVFIAIAACCLATAAAAEDVVILGRPSQSDAWTRISGEVLDFTGRGLRLRLPGGREVEYPALQVLGVETSRQPQHLAGDKLYENDEFAAAEEKYRAALGHEQRGWVRRELLAASARCQRELGNWPAAARLFAGLVASDPDTWYLDLAPLAWEPARTVGSEETIESKVVADMQAATVEWLAAAKPPALELLAASWHIDGPRQAEAVEALNRLSQSPPSPAMMLARLQLYRLHFSALSPLLLDGMQGMLEGWPFSMSAGGWLLVGRAASRLELYDRAALAWLRIAALYPDQRQLGARGMLAAAGALAAADHTDEAIRLCQRVAAQYSRLDAARDAQTRLATLRAKEEAPP
jgi:tetratricopeptide (TPR) repeat protein